MRRFVLICIFPILCCANSVSQVREGHISVNGQAEIRIAPDEVILAVGIETYDSRLMEAKSANDKKSLAVTAAARELGIAGEHLKTDYLTIEPRYFNHEVEKGIIGYVVRRSVVMTLREPTKFEQLLSAALSAGATHVHSVDFRTTQLRKYRDQARSMALDAAREKAEAMTARFRKKVGQPVRIEEGHSGWWSPYGSWWGPRWGGGMTQNVVQQAGPPAVEQGPTAPGQISVSANVTVEFALIE